MKCENLDSFPRIYYRYYKPIYKYAKKYISSAHIAEEITQDVFLKIYQYRDSFNSNYEVSSWIWTIARNTIFDHLRKIRSSCAAHSQSLEELAQETSFEPFSIETAESILIEKTEKKKLSEMMTGLSHKQKEAIFLRLVKKFSYLEISNSMNLSLSAVKSLINRGKTTLMAIAQTESPPGIECP